MIDKDYFNSLDVESSNIVNKDCLKGGPRTEIGPNVLALARLIPDDGQGHSTKRVVTDILYTMNEKLEMRRGDHPERKFTRSAEEIISDGYRDGCCDSSTVFVSLCRAKGIPAFQVITAKISDMQEGKFNIGHFFAGFYSPEENKWYIVDSNADFGKLRFGLSFHDFCSANNFFDPDYLPFAYVRDYSEVSITSSETGETYQINSSKSMREIHKLAYNNHIQNQASKPQEEREF